MSRERAAARPHTDARGIKAPQARSAALSALQAYRLREEMPDVFECARPEDSRLAERLFYGVLQNERFLDDCLSRYLTSAKTHPLIRDLLRLSAYQILFLDRIPDSAAVNEAVRICRGSKQSYAAGMVNAVLRRVSADKNRLLTEYTDLAVRFSHPDWLVRRLLREHEEPFVRAFLESSQAVPDLCLQINTRILSVEDYVRRLRLQNLEPVSVCAGFPSARIGTTRVDTLPGYREGCFYVQDDAARASVRCIGIQPGMHVLDACAAPGGKSMAAALEGASVLSCDVNEGRLGRCEENFRRLHLEIPMQIQDAAVFCPEFDGAFDVVIADVPCSGTGVIRRHPEIRRRTEAEVQELCGIQNRILRNLSRYVKPGGILLYSTCSVLRDEDEAQVEAFLAGHPDFRLLPVTMPGFDCQNGMLRSWPQQNGNDGFFAAKLGKKND